MTRDRTILRAWTGLLVIAWLSVSCTDSVGPKRETLGTPSFSFSANGITLNTHNGALGYQATTNIIKGFDPRPDGTGGHPRNGDAIIATVFWVNGGNRSNLVATVTDHRTDATLSGIGNTYTLVAFVTAGDISMASYVATNVQWDSTPGYRYAVRATMSQPVSDGGIKISAWTGVEDVFSAASEAVQSDSASGSTPTTIAPGPITIGAGSLAYTVSLSNGGVGRLSDPSAQGFTTLGGLGSDGVIQDDGYYFVSPGGGPVDPQWTWDFQRPSTALATVLALKPGRSSTNQAPTASFTRSCSGLTCSFTSTSSDPDGSIARYSWNFGDGTSSTLQNPSHTYTAGGTYTVTLQVTDNLEATSNLGSQTFTVSAPNSPPVVNAGPDQTVLLGLLYRLDVSFSDPDNGPWTYRIQWGDGSSSTGTRSSQGSFSVQHTYLGLSVLGTRTITVTITDSQGASGSDTKNVKIVLF